MAFYEHCILKAYTLRQLEVVVFLFTFKELI